MKIINKHLSDYSENMKCDYFYITSFTPGEEAGLTHRNDFYQILLVTNGKLEVEVDFKKCILEEGMAAVIFPHQVNTLKSVDDAGVECIKFDETVFCSELLSNELKDYNIDLQNKINFVDLREKREVFESLRSLYKRMSELYADLNMVRMMQIKFMIKTMLLQIIDASPSNKIERSNEADTQLYIEFRKEVDANFHTKRNVGEYAEMLGVSSKKLNDVCKQYNGMSPLNIIHEKLTLELKKAFLEDNRSLKEISFEFGFSSQSALNKFIASKFGCTPNEFKERLLS